MEKVRFTRNMLTGKPVIKISYCGAWYLLKDLQPVGYTAGVYGWNADVYDVPGAWIVTGYRFYGIRGKYADSDFLDFCEKVAKNLMNISDNPYPLIADIREKFIASELSD